MKRRAECSCGQLAVEVLGDPLRISMCHCLACQRRTGSVFGAQARFAREKAVISGRATTFTRVGDDGGRATFSFCPACGATVYYQIEDMPEVLAIPVGAFADPGFPAPRVSVYEARKHGWVVVPEGVEHYD